MQILNHAASVTDVRYDDIGENYGEVLREKIRYINAPAPYNSRLSELIYRNRNIKIDGWTKKKIGFFKSFL